MKEGSVIVDLAAEMGGNCKLTEADKVVVKHGVTIIGYTDLPSRLATQSSQLYATNLRHLLTDLTPEKDGEIVIDMEDEIIRGATVIKNGEITWPPPAPKLSAAARQKSQLPVACNSQNRKEKELHWGLSCSRLSLVVSPYWAVEVSHLLNSCPTSPFLYYPVLSAIWLSGMSPRLCTLR